MSALCVLSVHFAGDAAEVGRYEASQRQSRGERT